MTLTTARLQKSCLYANKVYENKNDEFNLISVDGADVAVFKEDTETVTVAFRGSSELVDFIADVDFIRRKNINGIGRVHYGFYNYTNNTLSRLEQLLSSIENIHVTGHSLGGAMAVLFCCLCSEITQAKIRSLTTFGQPRTLNSVEKFRDFYLARFPYVRIINDSDIIPHLPGRWWSSYNHTGGTIVIDEYNNVRTPINAVKTSRLLWTSWIRAILRMDVFDAIGDHSCSKYVEKVQFIPQISIDLCLEIDQRPATKKTWWYTAVFSAVVIGTLLVNFIHK